jgi:hypothetical protein
MRHRICNISTGLGNPEKELLSNKGILSQPARNMLNEAINLYFKKWNGCDFSIKENKIDFGIEPAYQYEDLKIISINRQKGCSYIKIGRAFGDYGSGIRATTKYYADYKKDCKFTKFIDKWHNLIFKQNNKKVTV